MTLERRFTEAGRIVAGHQATTPFNSHPGRNLDRGKFQSIISRHPRLLQFDMVLKGGVAAILHIFETKVTWCLNTLSKHVSLLPLPLQWFADSKLSPSINGIVSLQLRATQNATQGAQATHTSYAAQHNPSNSYNLSTVFNSCNSHSSIQLSATHAPCRSVPTYCILWVGLVSYWPWKLSTRYFLSEISIEGLSTFIHVSLIDDYRQLEIDKSLLILLQSWDSRTRLMRSLKLNS